MVCDIGVALAFYALFKPVSRNLSLVALLFRLGFVAGMIIDSLDYFGSAHSAHDFDTLYMLALVPFGIHCLLIGYLIYKSTFLPRFLGVLMIIAGLCYVTFVSPSFIHYVSPYILIPGAIGEGTLTLWLLIASVNSVRWAQQAGVPPPAK